ncbi:hypothetical protein T484DRAFT_1970707 [Baffinella frigidus]|nr:hypothetical protein T484DRAFT_1970707 [Cryptophyta sp. CCMP2293]
MFGDRASLHPGIRPTPSQPARGLSTPEDARRGRLPSFQPAASDRRIIADGFRAGSAFCDCLPSRPTCDAGV